MNINAIQKHQWQQVKDIYLEAFPKSERKPFFLLKHSVKSGKAELFTASEGEQLMGFVVVIPYRNMVMVDYLAVNGKVRSKGTGSQILAEICRRFQDKKIVLLIEQPDDRADNCEQRIARKRFYLKNGFTPSGIVITGSSGRMEILNFGGTVSPGDYLDLQQYALGGLFFRLSGITLAAQ
jgi:GNAT superfamily N-acetyltransferase